VTAGTAQRQDAERLETDGAMSPITMYSLNWPNNARSSAYPARCDLQALVPIHRKLDVLVSSLASGCDGCGLLRTAVESYGSGYENIFFDKSRSPWELNLSNHSL
jgi:hypothetical protein